MREHGRTEMGRQRWRNWKEEGSGGGAADCGRRVGRGDDVAAAAAAALLVLPEISLADIRKLRKLPRPPPERVAGFARPLAEE